MLWVETLSGIMYFCAYKDYNFMYMICFVHRYKTRVRVRQKNEWYYEKMNFDITYHEFNTSALSCSEHI